MPHGAVLIGALEAIGEAAELAGRGVIAGVRRFWKLDLVRQLDSIAVSSLPIVILTAMFSSMVMTFQIGMQFERFGSNLRQHRFQSLTDRRRSDEDRNRSISLGDDAGVFPRAGAAAFNKAANRDAVIAVADMLAVQRDFVRPAELAQAMVECRLIVAAVA